MKINISGLMNMIAEDERKCSSLSNSLRTKVYSVSIQELNGTVNVIEDYKDEFDKELEEYRKIMSKISKLKSMSMFLFKSINILVRIRLVSILYKLIIMNRIKIVKIK